MEEKLFDEFGNEINIDENEEFSNMGDEKDE